MTYGADTFLDSECRLRQRDGQSSGTGCCRIGSRGQCETDCRHDYAVLRRSGIAEVLHLAGGPLWRGERILRGTIAGSKGQQDAALAHLSSNADEIAVFLSGANPNLPKDFED